MKLGKMPETPIGGVTENAEEENKITDDSNEEEIKDPTEIEGELSVNEADSDYDKDAFLIDEDGDTIPKASKDAGDKYIDETLFIGDSNTVRMMNYGYTSLDNTIALVGMGIQSVKTLQCVEFAGYSSPVTMVEATKLMQPRRIIITFGTNNANGMDTETFIQKYEEALDALHDAYPYADILINSIPPICKENKYPTLSIKAIDQFNVALFDMAKKRGLKFLNTSAVMKDEKTGYAKDGFTVGDGIHISEDGFNAMFEYIRTHSFVTEDTRPKPLKDIPNQNKNTYVITGGKLKSDPKSYDQMSVDPKATGTPEVKVPEKVTTPDPATCKHESYKENIVKQPTESEEGKIEYICNTCGYKTYGTIDKVKHEHRFNKVDSKCVPSTETNKGYEYYQCDCGESYTKELPLKEPTAKPETEKEVKPEVVPEAKPEVKPEPQPKPEPEVKPQPEPEVKPDPKPEPEVKPQPQPEPEVKPEPTPEPEQQPETTPDPEPEPDSEPTPEPEPAPEEQVTENGGEVTPENVE